MNKYQKVLDKLKKYEVDNGSEFFGSGYSRLDKIFKKEFNTLQELVDQTKTPTLEEVKKEWGKLGYEWRENPDISEIHLINKKGDCKIEIDTFLKTYYVREYYSCEYQHLLFKEHQLLSKTFRALGWNNEM